MCRSLWYLRETSRTTALITRLAIKENDDYAKPIINTWCYSSNVLEELRGALDEKPAETWWQGVSRFAISLNVVSGRRNRRRRARRPWSFAAEIAAGERVEFDLGTIRMPVPLDGQGEVDWHDAPF
ncbi:hypothetical protein M8542_44175 [Amycolatopsis sp. OK19-0408]|uniref:Uncharacterized protein n=1 Tax=Amycolatopsis iheyensis TaxID=2945988 RepID=A0A9X2SP89_9PSEU|nr:hypothetical protein [Amycolatopsis iheyensis]MCR6489832.1 hypothetical protein [Amycolatopsis iheyensis]